MMNQILLAADAENLTQTNLYVIIGLAAIALVSGAMGAAVITMMATRRKTKAETLKLETEGDSAVKDSLRKDVQGLLEKVGRLESESEATVAEVAEVKTENGKLQKKVGQLQNANRKLTVRVNALEQERDDLVAWADEVEEWRDHEVVQEHEKTFPFPSWPPSFEREARQSPQP